MKESKDVKNWDDFRDRFNNRYYTEGIAELGRWYIKNKEFVHHHIPDDEDDKTVIPIPFSARGITAFLIKDDYTSFSSDFGPNKHLDSHVFYKVYFDHCIKYLIEADHRNNRIKEDQSSFEKLVKLHLKKEEQYYLDSSLFYSEFTDESKIEYIKRVTLLYLKWVKATQIKEDNSSNNQKDIVDPKTKEEIGVIIDDILKNIFPSINSSEMVTLKKNLGGGSTYLALNFIGKKLSLYYQLSKLRTEGGIDRKEIARVFAKHVKWRSSNSSITSIALDEKVLYKKI